MMPNCHEWKGWVPRSGNMGWWDMTHMILPICKQIFATRCVFFFSLNAFRSLTRSSGPLPWGSPTAAHPPLEPLATCDFSHYFTVTTSLPSNCPHANSFRNFILIQGICFGEVGQDRARFPWRFPPSPRRTTLSARSGMRTLCPTFEMPNVRPSHSFQNWAYWTFVI